jgi:hypothetical protein
VVGALFSMHLERIRGESNKFEPAICIDCGGGAPAHCLVIYAAWAAVACSITPADTPLTDTNGIVKRSGP